ncbi:phosphatidylglycerophosphatase A-like protein [Thermanaerovibrio velox DSM 12556]|uniref:Phosphatidylglycerophosphatase A-like protein n=1 Tax=Thermanaerovibrio velox DSM 12556 TaxID=926567 RepID=H0UNE3_9BACT|nr:phosphatidylglycerophosphatase A [Thermanaerovibrio velox]EHM09350.1 phosphatidylglycerophosphatase A-like protein [Thermanaerovibrio velox DSM 12556]
MRDREAFMTWYGMVSTCFGLGLSKWAPGTVGSFGAFVLALLMGRIPLAALVGVIVVGTAASHRYSHRVRVEDPPEVVIDEVAGYWAAQYALPMEMALGTLLLFRIVDIAKPFPIRRFEALPGGVGIMADDLAGGIMVNLIVRFTYYLLFQGGLAGLYAFFS